MSFLYAVKEVKRRKKITLLLILILVIAMVLTRLFLIEKQKGQYGGDAVFVENNAQNYDEHWLNL